LPRRVRGERDRKRAANDERGEQQTSTEHAGNPILGTVVLLLLTCLLGAQTPASDANDALWDAARSGDTARVAAVLDKGVDVNAKARYGATALFFAADKGHLETVKLLVARGAEINLEDTFYRFKPIDLALENGHADVGIFLLEKGAKGGGFALISGVRSNNAALVKAALKAPDVDRRALQSALAIAEREKRTDLAAPIKTTLDALPADATPSVQLDPAVLQRYAGRYRNEAAGVTATIGIRDGQLVAEVPGQPPITFTATSETTFRAREMDGLTIAFNGRGGLVESVTVTEPGRVSSYVRLTDSAAAATPAPAPTSAPPVSLDPAPRTAARNWPSFRGEHASGRGDGQGALAEWDVATRKNIKWKTAIPGIATASPIVWGDRIFVTTAVSTAGDSSFRTGLYGDVKPVDDLSEHAFKVYCLDKATGKILWERTAHSGAPKVKRHTKSTQANSTPATDGKRVVAVFGSIGLLVAYDTAGKELWRADTGILDSGWFFDPTYQWGHSSSPVIYKNSVIVQADLQKGSYIAAWDLATGKQLWKTDRADEIPTWGTPTLVTGGTRDEIVTNGTKIRGYDPATGKVLWTLGPNSEVTVGTPVAENGLIYVTGGYPPVRPIYVVRAGSSGDISLPAGKESSDAIVWSNSREGTYIPTPILYGGYFFTCNNNGIVNVYDSKTGQRVGRGRVGEGGAFSASPIAADGKLYLASEDGDIHVIRASPGLEPLVKNSMKEVIMATPAVSDGLLIVRTLGHVYGIGRD
jgi:outer membrane protein assembly factor BamB